MKIVIGAGESDIWRKLIAMTEIDPSASHGIEEIVLGHQVIGRDRPIPSFWSDGYEEIHQIDHGFCMHLTDAFIEHDWRISAAGSDRNLRLRIVLAGEAGYTTGASRLSDENSRCSFIIRSAGDVLTGKFEGGKRYRYCSLNVSSSYLQQTLALSREQLPAMLLDHWERQEIVMGTFPLSKATLTQARKLFIVKSVGAWRDMEIRANTLNLLRLVFADWSIEKANVQQSMLISHIERSKLIQIRDLVEKEAASSVKLPQLCSKFQINRNKLHYGFKQLFGVSVHGYQTECRMRLAMNLLSSTLLTVSEVADQAGYSEPTNFTAAFKRHFCLLPTQIRRSGNISKLGKRVARSSKTKRV